MIARAHQLMDRGYCHKHNDQVVTIFSAPNYCGEFDNSGSLMTVDEELMCSFQILKPIDNLNSHF